MKLICVLLMFGLFSANVASLLPINVLVLCATVLPSFSESAQNQRNYGCSSGIPGIPGMPGQPGAPGRDGREGREGKQGPRGFQGPPGSNVSGGKPGARGPVGAKGEKGDGGPPGQQGPSGSPGSDGKPGARGPVGAKGEKGYNGTSGQQGPPGSPGSGGKSGPPGPVGAKGDRGPSGLSFHYNWKECSWKKVNDGRDNGPIKQCVFNKIHSDTFLHVYWNGDFGTHGCIYCCKRWFFSFNGAECQFPNTIDGTVHPAGRPGVESPVRLHSVKTIQGHCGNIHKGQVRVGFNVGNCAGFGKADAATGFGSVSRIFVEEVPKPQP